MAGKLPAAGFILGGRLAGGKLGKVATIFEMINWCIRNPAEGQPLAADDPDMIALIAYMTHERRGAILEPGKH